MLKMDKNAIFTGLLYITLVFTPKISSATSIVEAMHLALENNSALKSSEYSFKAINTALTIGSIAPFLPTVEYDISIIDSDKQKLKTGTTQNIENVKSGSLVLSQSLFAGGADVLGIEKASELKKVAYNRYLLSRQSTAEKAAKVYLDFLAAVEVEKLAEKQLKALSEYLKSVQKRFELGETTKTDVQQTEVRVNLAKAEKIRSSGNLQNAHAAYFNTIGEDPIDLSHPTNFPKIPTSLESALETARQNNLELTIAYSTKVASDSEAGIAAAHMLPTLSLNISKTDKSQIDPLIQEESIVSLQARFPIFQGGRSAAALAQALYKSRQGQYDYLQSYNALTEQVISQWNNIAALKLIVEASEGAISAATTAFEGIKKEASLSIKTTIDVLNAEKDLFKSKVDLVNARKDYALSMYALSGSIGILLEYVE